MSSLRKLSRIAGFGYLIIFITGIYANFFVLEGLLVPGNAAATADNIIANEMLFRFGILSFIIMVIFDVVLAWALYILLRPVNRDLSLFSGWLRLVNSTIFAVALFNLFGILQYISGAGYLQAFETGQLQSQVMSFFDAFNHTWLIGLVFFGLHLFFLGYLIVRSGYIPKIIGILLIIAAAGYLIDSFANFLMPDYADYKSIFSLVVVIPGVIGELSFTLWLLIRGVRDDQGTV
ncbi:MAG: DUF4386 domain-containing protein [Bacteroidales bacterium]|jgi:hypothetical protein